MSIFLFAFMKYKKGQLSINIKNIQLNSRNLAKYNMENKNSLK